MSSDVTWLESMPEVYDRELGPALFHPFAEHLASLTREMAPGRVLELAAGTGIATSALARALPDAHITATDLNPAMVSWATQREPRATWLEADAQEPQFSDGSFDLVVCQFGSCSSRTSPLPSPRPHASWRRVARCCSRCGTSSRSDGH
jgi:SAM-dependent methyltransferase